MRITNLLFILLFLVAAFLQLNDPDPVLWFSIYFLGVVICSFALFKKLPPAVLYIALTVYAAYAFYLFINPDGVLSWYRDHKAENIAQTMKADKPWIEETREFFGLLILCTAVILNLLFPKFSRNLNHPAK